MSTGAEQLGGHLYSDEREDAILNSSAQLKFDYYQDRIAELSHMIRQSAAESDSSLWQSWENGIRQIYKEMIFDAFKARNIKPPPKMEVHFAGSLAKAQATEFSDLDAFVLVEKEEDVATVRPIFLDLNNLCQRIFKETKQLYPDPIGINPGRLIGTPDNLYHMLKDGEVPDVDATVRSIFTSKPVLARYELGERLRHQLKQDPTFKKLCSAEIFYNTASKDYPAPKKTAKNINIKTHIMRPIDFILMGLREEFNLYNEDGSHLSAPGTLSLLRERQVLPEEDIARIESVYTQAMAKRFNLHAEHRTEHDEMPLADAEHMLAEVAKLREMATGRMNAIKAGTAINSTLKPDESKGFFARHADTFKTIGMVAGVALAATAVGVGLALGGVLAIPLAVAAAGAVVSVAVLSYGIYKGIEALSLWISSKTSDTKGNSSDDEPVIHHQTTYGGVENYQQSSRTNETFRPASIGAALCYPKFQSVPGVNGRITKTC